MTIWKGGNIILETLKISTEHMQFINNIMYLLCFVSLIYFIFMKFESSTVETLFALVKTVGYGLLAIIIYKATFAKNEIDILTFFTYLLACFETAHNFSNSVSKWIAAVIKIFFHKNNEF